MRLTDTLWFVGSGEMRLTDQYDCNVYAIEAPDGPVLVDAGAGREPERVHENLRNAVGDPAAVLLTHAHADHSQGGPYFQEHDVPVVAPEPSAPLLSAGSDRELGLDLAKRDDVYPADYEFEHFEPDRTIEPGTWFTLADRSFEAVQTRGHAADHVAYVTETDDRTVCFVADAINTDGSINLLNTPDSSLADYRADIDNLVDRDIDALLPGHGMPRLEDGEEPIDQAADSLAGMFSPPSRT